MIRVGVDTGGTFTDLVLLESGTLTVHKVRSTPNDPSEAIVTGLAELLSDKRAIEIVHGSTVGTNALLERKGARVALITTAGFEDVLRIGRQTRRELYNFFVQQPAPIIQPDLVFGIAERIAADGTVLIPLDDRALQHLPQRLRELHVDSVAVCLLHSYANSAHELRVGRLLEQAGFAVSISHLVLAEYREVERWNTTAANAYLTPIMSRYLTGLEQSLAQHPIRVMQSNGGSISAARAREVAVRTVLSGPAAGVVGAVAAGRASSHSRVITFDMGGTSTDVSLVDGEIGRTMESSIGEIPIRLPVIDIHTVGAGGGSIAYFDAAGALRVGPRSAGAHPGPVCYGQGSELTVTDANLLLGRLHPEAFLGGRMHLDIDRTYAIASELAARLAMSVASLADGIVRVANSNMERAIRVVSVQRGFDPRDFALLAFGGAGGLHACDLADALDMQTVIIPEHSGVLSALGLLVADVMKDYSLTVLKSERETDLTDLTNRFQPMLERAAQELRVEGFHPDSTTTECKLDIRYRGQAYEITVPFAPGYRAEFDRSHQKLYGYSNPGRQVEIVNLRVIAAGLTDKPVLGSEPCEAQPVSQPLEIGRTFFAGVPRYTPVFQREALIPGMQGQGPALFVGRHSTTLIPPHFEFRIDGAGALVAVNHGQREVPVFK